MPDFLLADGTYIEIKGYVTDQARAKFEYFLRPLQVFTRTDLDRMSSTCTCHMARTCSVCTSRMTPGRVAERTIAVLLKSTEAARLPWVRIPPLPPQT